MLCSVEINTIVYADLSVVHTLLSEHEDLKAAICQHIDYFYTPSAFDSSYILPKTKPSWDFLMTSVYIGKSEMREVRREARIN